MEKSPAARGFDRAPSQALESHEALVLGGEDKEGVEESRLHEFGRVEVLERSRAADGGDLANRGQGGDEDAVGCHARVLVLAQLHQAREAVQDNDLRR